MKFVVEDIKPFRAMFDTISKILDEATMEFSEKGIELKGLDRSHISFVHLAIGKDYFLTYEFDGLEKINFDTEEFIKVLRRGKKDDIVEITATQDRLEIVFEGEAKRTFGMGVIDISYEHPKPPELEFPINFDMPISVFKDSLDDVKLFGDVVSLKHKDDRVVITGENEYGEANFEFITLITNTEEVNSKFSLDKLQDMMKAKDVGEYIHLRLGNDMPLSLSIGDDNANINFLLAPRIESE